ncbi:hypothetical protein JCM19274_1013 [Algibacter lectus]|uniref:Uncharacterized protein n=1 Tax=Algibacter lectus TaxID=221126 RepID=A0A090WT70_9FLAO|nr:hypothetical protein JCM19274_1013 [Algibacter lectus]
MNGMFEILFVFPLKTKRLSSESPTFSGSAQNVFILSVSSFENIIFVA